MQSSQSRTGEDSTNSVDDSNDSTSGGNQKALDQGAIDDLFGFEENNQEINNKGIKAMVDRATNSYERLPMLEVIFEKFIRLLSVSLRNLAEDNVDLSIKSIQSMRFGSYINAIPIPALVSVFKAIEWGQYGLIVADTSLIFSLIDILFGGRKAHQPVKIEGRPYTPIEQSLVKQLAEICLVELSKSFEAIDDVNFVYERMESDPRFASIARQGDSSILIKINVEIEDKSGVIEILFPYSTLEPIKKSLTQVFIGEQFGVNDEWQIGLLNKLDNTSINIEAILFGKITKVWDINQFKVGSTIQMQNSPDDNIIIKSNGMKVGTGKLGKLGSKVAIALNEPLKCNNNDEHNND